MKQKSREVHSLILNLIHQPSEIEALVVSFGDFQDVISSGNPTLMDRKIRERGGVIISEASFRI